MQLDHQGAIAVPLNARASRCRSLLSAGCPGECPFPDPGHGSTLRRVLSPGDAEKALLWLVMESELWQLLWPGEGPLAMHGILSVGGPTRCAFSLLSFITGIPKGSGRTVLCGPIHGLELKRFSNSCWPCSVLALAKPSSTSTPWRLILPTASCSTPSISKSSPMVEHHVLDRLDPPYRGLFQMVVPSHHRPSILVLRPSVSSPAGWIRSTTFMPTLKMT